MAARKTFTFSMQYIAFVSDSLPKAELGFFCYRL